MTLLALFGLALLFPSVTARLMDPVANIGSKLSRTSDPGEREASFFSSLLLGAATGFLWAPCAGPLLGLILTGAARANIQTSLLLLTYAAGASSLALALALAVGGKVIAAMKRSFGVGEWIRRGVGVAALVAVAAITLGPGFLTRLSLASTASLEQRQLDRLHPKSESRPESSAVMTGGPTMMNGKPAMTGGGVAMMSGKPAMTSGGPAMMAKGKPVAEEKLGVERPAPEIAGVVAWLNSAPLTINGLKGKVVLVDFWTYSCINCLQSIPNVQAWADKCKDAGLVVVGVHAPVFAFEKSIANVTAAVGRLGISYPVAIDNDYGVVAWTSMRTDRVVVSEQRLYQLVRQGAPGRDHTFEIRFLDPGAHAYAFTFG